MKSLQQKIEAIEATKPRWALVITDGNDFPPADDAFKVIHSYVDGNVRVWFLFAEEPSKILDASMALDRFSRSGIPQIEDAIVRIPDPEGGPPLEAPLDDVFEIVGLAWAKRLSQKLGLTEQAKRFEELAVSADTGVRKAD
jgi:hypothetical protein